MRTLAWLAALALVCAAFFLLFMAAGHTHDYARPELKSWFMGLHNSQGTPCCDGEDAVHVEDADWTTSCEGGECHYMVRLDGRWFKVPDSALVFGPNKSGTALVWPIRYGFPPESGKPADYAIRCFLPGTQG